MSKMNPVEMQRLMALRHCYYCPDVPNGHEVAGEDKRGHYYVGVVVEGEPGYFATDWDYGTDRKLAQQCVDELNEKRGIPKADADNIILSSMFARQ